MMLWNFDMDQCSFSEIESQDLASKYFAEGSTVLTLGGEKLVY
jgi:glutamine cyclotransferase